MISYDPRKFRGAIATVDRLLQYGQTDGASICALFMASGEPPPHEIWCEQDALHELPKDRTMELAKKIGGANPKLPC